MVLAAYLAIGLAGPASSTTCVVSGHCEGLFYRGVGELLQVGNGEVYTSAIVERWWRTSLLTEPSIQQSFVGTPASLPFHTLYGLGSSSSQSVGLGMAAAVLVGFLCTMTGGLLFSLSVLVGGAVAAGVVFGTPSLFLAVGALLVHRGLDRGGSWWAGIGLTLLAFRLEFAAVALVFLGFRGRIGPLVVASILSGMLWAVAGLIWGGDISTDWAQSLQHPPSGVDAGVGLLGIIPGANGQWISLWWLVYGGLAAMALRRSRGMTVVQGFAFLLAVGLLASPQVTPEDYALLTPFFLAFFSRPERPALVFGIACYGLALVGMTVLLPLVALTLLSFGQDNLDQEVC